MTLTASAPTARPPKDPAKQRAGRIGAATRWGADPHIPPRVIVLDDLDAPARRLVMALVDAARREAERTPDNPAERSSP